MTDLKDLSIHQAESLQRLREMASDIIKPEHHDHYLFRWLQACNFDPNKTLSMLRKSFAWRQKFGIDEIIDTYEAPLLCDDWMNMSSVGQDKDGCPLWIIPAGSWDLKGLFSSIPLEEIILVTIHHAERFLKKVEEKWRKEGRYVWKQTAILDMEGLDYTLAFWKPAWKMTINLTQMMSSNYPDPLNKVIIINAPNFLATIFSILRPSLGESIRKKLQVFNNDRSKWIPAIMEIADPNEFPKYWGGNCVDPDGNPKCPSKVLLLDKVPLTEYISRKTSSLGKSFKKVVIKNGDTFELEVRVSRTGVTLKWMFYTDGMSIDFSMNRRDSANNTEEIVPNTRMKSFYTLLQGEVTCSTEGTYVMTFDNSYYKLRSKFLWYSVQAI